MKRRPGWAKASAATIVAAGLVVITLFALANFVLVDVRLLGATLRVRLAWVAVLPGLGGFVVGVAYARLTRRANQGSVDAG